MNLQSQHTQHAQITRQFTRIPHLRKRRIGAGILAGNRSLAPGARLRDAHAPFRRVHDGCKSFQPAKLSLAMIQHFFGTGLVRSASRGRMLCDDECRRTWEGGSSKYDDERGKDGLAAWTEHEGDRVQKSHKCAGSAAGNPQSRWVLDAADLGS